MKNSYQGMHKRVSFCLISSMLLSKDSKCYQNFSQHCHPYDFRHCSYPKPTSSILVNERICSSSQTKFSSNKRGSLPCQIMYSPRPNLKKIYVMDNAQIYEPRNLITKINVCLGKPNIKF